MLLAAVPNPQAGLASRKEAVRGDVPSLIDPPPGCPFANRCHHVMDVCRKVMPGAELIGPGHWVKCHLYGPGETKGPGSPGKHKHHDHPHHPDP
jgi:peptide/nickel transport system ATP-binding protein